MITITTKAADKVKGILEQEKENLPEGGLRDLRARRRLLRLPVRDGPR